MLQLLADRIWADDRFHAAAKLIEIDNLRKDLFDSFDELKCDIALAGKAMQAAAVLAASERPEHRQAAYRVATSAFELFGCKTLPLNLALRVVLTRLGNFPAFNTRIDVEDSYKHLPIRLGFEELDTLSNQIVTIGNEDIALTPFQHELWNKLQAKERLIISSPTSSGKSFILQAFLASRFQDFHPTVVVYLVPTRALISQVSEDLAIRFANEGLASSLRVVTVPPEKSDDLPERAVYVLTQERAQLCLSNHATFQADLLIVDEAQGISDGSRGVLLQWVIDDLLFRYERTQVLFASPLIQNPRIFGHLFGLNDIVSVPPAEPTVSQAFIQVDVAPGVAGRIKLRIYGDGSKTLEDVAVLEIGHPLGRRRDKLVHVPMKLGKGQTNIIYVDGPVEAEEVAISISELLSGREPTEYLTALADLTREAVHEKYALVRCVQKGVAFHYSLMPAVVRRAVEQAVSGGEINFLVCTSTLLQGVNLPARNIFMLNPRKGIKNPLLSTNFWNLSGRAGRLGQEFQGNIYLIDYDSWKVHPLDGPKAAEIVPAMERSLTTDRETLFHVIEDRDGATVTTNRSDSETVFGKLLADVDQGTIDVTLSRAGLMPESVEASDLKLALLNASKSITLPARIYKMTPSFSAHKQQRLFEYIESEISKKEGRAEEMIPYLPHDRDAYNNYREILRLGFIFLLGRDTKKDYKTFTHY